MSFEQFPGFKVPPNDPSREVRKPITICPQREETDYDDAPYHDEYEDDCPYCEGWGYTDCRCGGDLCICEYNGEIPCFHCG